jgi:hypothetical protein
MNEDELHDGPEHVLDLRDPFKLMEGVRDLPMVS